MFRKRKDKMPMPVTVNDCLLLWQMGYEVEVNNGIVTAVKKEKAEQSQLKQNIQFQFSTSF